MDIYLLRHGEYIDTGSETIVQDKQNRLSDAGIATLHHQGAALTAWKLPIEQILSSPFVRAKQTAEIFAAAFHLSVIETPLLTRTEFDLAALQQLLQDYAGHQHLLLVGHEPDFSRTAAAIMGGGKLEIERGGLLHLTIHLDPPLTGTLKRLLRPEDMRG